MCRFAVRVPLCSYMAFLVTSFNYFTTIFHSTLRYALFHLHAQSLLMRPHIFNTFRQCRNLLPASHRLRFSASPQAPTYPERTNLPQETLGFRWDGFSPSSRYLFRHSHLYAVHYSSQYSFILHTTLLYHSISLDMKSKASVYSLAPVIFGARPLRLVSYYALFKCMAASEPTSQLSMSSYILFHLTIILGPQLLVWALSLLTMALVCHCLTPVFTYMAFLV